jgi:hypothetical protein
MCGAFARKIDLIREEKKVRALEAQLKEAETIVHAVIERDKDASHDDEASDFLSSLADDARAYFKRKEEGNG